MRINLNVYLQGKDTIHSKKTGGIQATIDGLEIFESYYIKVSAFTKVGTGVRSDKLICTTAQDGNYITVNRNRPGS